MTSISAEPSYPRLLTEREQEWIEWILPADRSGYRRYREIVQSLVVLGEGRRGHGEIILGKENASIDLESPLPAVFAFGVIETNFGTLTITLREVQDDQISVEMVSNRGDFIPEEFEEFRRWTYSTWNPRSNCPQCLNPVREISIHTSSGEQFILAICVNDKRLWVHDVTSKVNKLIPVTNYYNELMLHKNIRDPKIALDSKRMFTDLATYSDEELVYAFLTYNAFRTKVHIGGKVQLGKGEKTSLFKRLGSIFKK